MLPQPNCKVLVEVLSPFLVYILWSIPPGPGKSVTRLQLRCDSIVTVSWLGNLATMKPPSTHRPLHIVTTRTPAAQHCNGEGSLNLQPFFEQAFNINLRQCLTMKGPKQDAITHSIKIHTLSGWERMDLKYRVSSFYCLILKSVFMNSP